MPIISILYGWKINPNWPVVECGVIVSSGCLLTQEEVQAFTNWVKKKWGLS